MIGSLLTVVLTVALFVVGWGAIFQLGPLDGLKTTASRAHATLWGVLMAAVSKKPKFPTRRPLLPKSIVGELRPRCSRRGATGAKVATILNSF